MKGIITDLDNTLWGGIWVEEDPATKDQGIYAQYQTLLLKLASEGILLAIASKNDDVRVPFDILQPKIGLESFFPVEANWGPKSESVDRILKTWNISADDVMFIDDSQFELMEVHEQHPNIKIMKFPKNPDEFPLFVQTLRGFFPKRVVTTEDKLRMESIRTNVAFHEEKKSGDEEEFYKGLNARLTFSFINDGNIDRAVELINKSNQFNLNGWRTTKEQFKGYIETDGVFSFVVNYEDKFGPLGTIAVVSGTEAQKSDWISISHFVLSCRAFSRRIEFEILKQLLEHTEHLHFNFQRTEKNKVYEDFASNLNQSGLSDLFFLFKDNFKCPPLYFEVTIP